MTLRLSLFICLATVAALMTASPANAKDCGMIPGDPPSIPDGTTATNDNIRDAVREIQDYGFDVQAYLNCQQLNRDFFFLNMDEPQRERWTEDYNAMADALTEVETELNVQIKVFNSRQ